MHVQYTKAKNQLKNNLKTKNIYLDSNQSNIYHFLHSNKTCFKLSWTALEWNNPNPEEQKN